MEIAVTTREPTSATGNAHHTILTFPERDKRYATGRRIISCLIRETVVAKNPRPKA